jgi:hypothetical protein
MPSRLPRYASLAFLLATLAPLSLPAQAAAPAALKFEVTLTIPVDVKDLNPLIDYFNLTCGIQPAGSSGTNGRVFPDNSVGGPIANGAFHGNVTAHYVITSQQPFAAGQQWAYTCAIAYLMKKDDGTTDHLSLTPGTDSHALIASGSGTMTGTFTTQ